MVCCQKLRQTEIRNQGMCMDFHDLVTSERELEEKGEKLLEKKSEVESLN